MNHTQEKKSLPVVVLGSLRLKSHTMTLDDSPINAVDYNSVLFSLIGLIMAKEERGLD